MQTPYNPLLLDHAHRHLDELRAEAARHALLRQARSGQQGDRPLLRRLLGLLSGGRQAASSTPRQRVA